MKAETRCSSENCPINQICANYSTEDKYNLIQHEFEVGQESDEQETNCSFFEDKNGIEFFN